jgi:hypothetical protein
MIIPALRYKDAKPAIDLLERASKPHCQSDRALLQILTPRCPTAPLT